MKKLYRAANVPDAHLILGLLEQDGIAAHIFNEHAQGGIGQLPFTEAWPEIWVSRDRDLERARAIVAAFECMPAVSSALHCSSCSEENPGTFQLCWNCGAALAPG